jgi:GT2 family glycosyltransferase
MSLCSVTAIVPAYERLRETLVTLEKIVRTRPRPNEILVHIDDNHVEFEGAIRQTFPEIKIFRSPKRVGPGGARNKLLSAAKNEIVVSFDDDSYPVDSDYFERVRVVFDKFPQAVILFAAVFHRGEAIMPPEESFEWVADFAGAGCAYRRSSFMATSGYLPLPVAYGMEEVDLALRLHADGKRILWTPWLRVFHDSMLEHHNLPAITAASIANLALLGYLRYPRSLWLTGVGQCVNRILWLLKHARWRGIVSGLLMIPKHLRKYKRYRLQVPSQAVRSYLALRRSPTVAEPRRE